MNRCRIKGAHNFDDSASNHSPSSSNRTEDTANNDLKIIQTNFLNT